MYAMYQTLSCGVSNVACLVGSTKSRKPESGQSTAGKRANCYTFSYTPKVLILTCTLPCQDSDGHKPVRPGRHQSAFVAASPCIDPKYDSDPPSEPLFTMTSCTHPHYAHIYIYIRVRIYIRWACHVLRSFCMHAPSDRSKDPKMVSL